MDAVSLLRNDFAAAWRALTATMADVTPEHAHWMPTGTANPISATYAHILFTTDMFVNLLMKHGTPLFATTWAGKTGASEPMPLLENWNDYGAWTRRLKVDLPAMQEYALAVHDSATEFLATLTPEALDQMVDLSALGAGQVPLGMTIARQLIAHTDSITGEISCLKGSQGAGGYHFS